MDEDFDFVEPDPNTHPDGYREPLDTPEAIYSVQPAEACEVEESLPEPGYGHGV